jgi:hypothetical protein
VAGPVALIDPPRKLVWTEAMYLAMQRVAEKEHEYREGSSALTPGRKPALIPAMKHAIVFTLALTFLGCDDKPAETKSDAKAEAKATAEDCKKAYEHLADLKVAKDPGDFTKEQLVDLDKGNIEQCTKKGSKPFVDCLLAIKAHDMMAIADCSDADKKN